MAFRELTKNARDGVRVTPQHFMGHDLIDVRIFTPSRDDPDKRIATKKGISINVDLVPDLLSALKWAVGQPCSEDVNAEEVTPISLKFADQLATEVADVLKSHGAAVHWDMAERLVRGRSKMSFDPWHLRGILVSRDDLFEHVGAGCFKAR